MLDGVKGHLLDAGSIDEAMRSYEAELAKANATAIGRRAQIERTLADTEGRLDRLLDLYERATIDADTFKVRSVGLESKRNDLRAELKTFETGPAYTLHPRAVGHYKSLIEDLQGTLAGDEANKAREAFQGLLDRVVIVNESSKDKGFHLQIEGRLAGLLSTNDNTLPRVSGKGAVVLGAGAGFEPATFRLRRWWRSHAKVQWTFANRRRPGGQDEPDATPQTQTAPLVGGAVRVFGCGGRI